MRAYTYDQFTRQNGSSGLRREEVQTGSKKLCYKCYSFVFAVLAALIVLKKGEELIITSLQYTSESRISGFQMVSFSDTFCVQLSNG
jgi:hypothetical protein